MFETIKEKIKQRVANSMLVKNLNMLLFAAGESIDTRSIKPMNEAQEVVIASAPNAMLGMMWVAVSSILSIVVGSFLLYIGLFLNATVVNSLPAVNDAAYNATLASTKSNVNTGFTVIGIMFIIIGASGCIVVLMSMIGSIGGGVPGRR